jgi:LmbE family N-acetylglucosaminyl deacetylase
MATLVTFHAHPDDEAIACGGTMAKAAAAGHRVVVVIATGGERGEVGEGVLRPGESLADRRRQETFEAAQVLGAARVEFLGYLDSGMAGTPANDDPTCFWQVPVDEAAARLAELLGQERPDAFTIYDENGTYGHPDHIQVHRVGVRAAELAGVDQVFEATINRDEFRRFLRQAKELGLPEIPETEGVDEGMGLPESHLTTAVDVNDQLETKRRAMAAHASQIPADSFFLTMPPAAFAAAFGTEWYRLRGAPPGLSGTDLLGD